MVRTSNGPFRLCGPTVTPYVFYLLNVDTICTFILHFCVNGNLLGIMLYGSLIVHLINRPSDFLLADNSDVF